jgi:cyclophilin family peptidyl-prolyl cis-trans isomerase
MPPTGRGSRKTVAGPATGQYHSRFDSQSGDQTMQTARSPRARFPIILLLVAGILAGPSAFAAEPVNVLMKTSLGEIRLELYPDQAPVTVQNFVDYANDGFYDGTIFHRVISHFMIQGGGFTPDMQKKTTREPIINEASNGLSNRRGTIAMARLPQPDSATAQFFINVQNNMNLDYKDERNAGYAVFGQVTGGMDVVDDIRFVQTTRVGPYSDVPAEPVMIEEVRVLGD